MPRTKLEGHSVNAMAEWSEGVLWLAAFGGLFFAVRLVGAMFTEESNELLRRRPVAHGMWALWFLASVLWVWCRLDRDAWPLVLADRWAQRREAVRRVEAVGGWTAVEAACAELVGSRTNWFVWDPGIARNAGTLAASDMSSYHVGPLSHALAGLQPKTIIYTPSQQLPEDGGRSVPWVSVRLFGHRSTGGHAEPYYGLAVPLGPRASEFRRPAESPGRTKERRHLTYRRVSGNVFEVY